jgi:hypothetical protein
MPCSGSRTRPEIKLEAEQLMSITSDWSDFELTFSAVVICDELDNGFANTVTGLGLKRGVPTNEF